MSEFRGQGLISLLVEDSTGCKAFGSTKAGVASVPLEAGPRQTTPAFLAVGSDENAEHRLSRLQDEGSCVSLCGLMVP